MDRLSENFYNSTLKPDAPKFKLWRYAGLLLTYKCPAACEFCYYNCGPDKVGLMPVDIALRAWQSLKNLAGESAKVHITGGEPFLYFDHLAEVMTEAQRLKLTPLDLLETNGFWATDRKIITDRLKFLDSAGMERLKISWDPFHAEFIDIEAVRLLIETALEVLGPQRVLVRWEKYLQEPVSKIREIRKSERLECYKSATEDYPCRFTGRAGKKLADFVAKKNIESFYQDNCRGSFLSAKGVHIDPYGNVFSGRCSGIIVGNVNQMSLENIWKKFDPQNQELIETIFTVGPAGLVKNAIESGYQVKQVYADKCHLCSDLRQFFFDIGKFNSIIGPCDCYHSSAGSIKENVLVRE